MDIGHKDIKILWARAFGRCCICRKKLVVDASAMSPSRATVVGENCHIVGEKHSSPRGKSILTEDERNRYPNLILLCREHHKVVDDDPDAWPIEKLHLLKGEHEVWVESLVPDDTDTDADRLYAGIVNSATQNLCLHSWPAITDHAIRDILPIEFADGVRQLAIDIKKANWPGKHAALETELKNVSQRASAYLDEFEELTCRARGDVLRVDHSWKRAPKPDFRGHSQRFAAWQQECERLLRNLTHALNQLAAAVRTSIRPGFFLLEGKFYISDSLGVTSGDEMTGVVHFINGYSD